MLRNVILGGVLAVLAGCGDPLSGLDRVSELDIPEQEAAAAALPTPEEAAREGFVGTQAAQPTEAAKAAADVAAATTEGTDAAAGEPVAVAETAPARKGVLGLLRRALPRPAEDATPVVAEASTAEATVAPDTQADAVASAVAASEAAVIDKPVVAELTPDTAQTAALAPQAAPPVEAAPADKPARRGLFGGSAKKQQARTGPDAREAEYGEVLPYGVIARSCASRGRPLGRKMEKANARGYALYDSTPGAGGARTWYLTGFSDGCPRQLTAANVQIAPASLYEQLRYGPSGKHFPSGATDAAYEGVKRKVCGARKGKPCGSKIGKMDKTTFFVTAYERFGNSSRWADVLVHDGTVVAIALKP